MSTEGLCADPDIEGLRYGMPGAEARCCLCCVGLTNGTMGPCPDVNALAAERSEAPTGGGCMLCVASTIIAPVAVGVGGEPEVYIGDWRKGAAKEDEG